VSAGCTRPGVSVEVLPPRTTATCSAPAANAAALGRGLFDVASTEDTHGSYRADVRLSVPGADVRVDGIRVAFGIPDGSSVAASDHDGEVLSGDVVLAGEKDDQRTAIVENVELVARALAVALRDDAGLAIDKIEYATLGVTITPVVDEAVAEALPSTFALDLCEGCLMSPPDACSDAGEFTATTVVCRPGQDVPLYGCNAAVVAP
jgi:hypothetical protein